MTLESDGDQIVDELVYRSYSYNRERFPDTTPERWSTVYPNVDAMERRYQRAINDHAEAMIRRDAEKPAWLRNLLTGGKDIPVGS